VRFMLGTPSALHNYRICPRRRPPWRSPILFAVLIIIVEPQVRLQVALPAYGADSATTVC
jgi:hypothetical protein